MRVVISILFSLMLVSANGQTPNNGSVEENSDGTLQAWDASTKTWVSIDSFWSSYAARKGGLTWGPSEGYPTYSDVEEFDTLLIELPQGNCLMEFFHRRWRRANDVRRWDDAFNAYGGCPYVFD